MWLLLSKAKITRFNQDLDILHFIAVDKDHECYADHHWIGHAIRPHLVKPFAVASVHA